jgi:hypothetical protein
MRLLLSCFLVLGLVGTAAAGELCLVPSAANGRNITVACGGVGYSNEQRGYGTDGASSCWEASCLFHGGSFAWSISSSSTDPHENIGPLGGTASLYLWLDCNNTGTLGMAAAEFGLSGSGLDVVAFTPMNGFLNAGTATELLIAVGGCPRGPLVAGRIDVEATVSVDGSTWGGIKGGYR